MTGILQFPKTQTSRADRTGSASEAAAPAAPLMLEISEEAFPHLDIEEIEDAANQRVWDVLRALGLCPYCAGKGSYLAEVSIGLQAQTMQILCGQCMGEGKRDAADTRRRQMALLFQILESYPEYDEVRAERDDRARAIEEGQRVTFEEIEDAYHRGELNEVPF